MRTASVGSVEASPPRPLASQVPDEVLLSAYHDRGDRAARERLIERHVPLVRRLAWRYRTRGEPHDDLVQSGCIGLVKAVDRFDRSRGDSLLAYAIPMILGEIQRHLRDHGSSSVVPPRPIRELAVALRRTADDLTASLGRSPTVGELADALGVDRGRVLEGMLALDAQQTVPLVDDPGAYTRPLDALGAPDRGFDLVDDRSVAVDSLRALDRRERTVVALSFFGGLTQAQIAARLGISQMHVSRVLRGALEKANAAADQHALAA
jgi:RNA polymerase sigma-B factor